MTAPADEEASKLGMWLFLVTEWVLFGGLFLAYAYVRHLHPTAFRHAGHAMNVPLGLLNTLVLITSSLTVALALETQREGRPALSRCFLTDTLILGVLFLAVKALEWSEKFRHGLTPGSPQMAALPPGEQVFFGLYFTMTGLHAVHVAAGLLVLAGLRITGRHQGPALEYAGLYWHLVDVIWIFLLPLFYLAA